MSGGSSRCSHRYWSWRFVHTLDEPLWVKPQHPGTACGGNQKIKQTNMTILIIEQFADLIPIINRGYVIENGMFALQQGRTLRQPDTKSLLIDYDEDEDYIRCILRTVDTYNNRLFISQKVSSKIKKMLSALVTLTSSLYVYDRVRFIYQTLPSDPGLAGPSIYRCIVVPVSPIYTVHDMGYIAAIPYGQYCAMTQILICEGQTESFFIRSS